jgi:hypothetical protein
VSNWLTEWERTGDTRGATKSWPASSRCRRCRIGLKSGKNLVFGYDPKTGKLYQVSAEVGSYNLATIQGGAQVVFELNEFFDHAGLAKNVAAVLPLGSAPAAVLTRDQETGAEGPGGPLPRRAGRASQGTPRLAAYAYWKTRNPVCARAATASLGRIAFGAGRPARERVEGPLALNAFDEAPRVGTNGAAQSGLTAIEILELCAARGRVTEPASYFAGAKISMAAAPVESL